MEVSFTLTGSRFRKRDKFGPIFQKQSLFISYNHRWICAKEITFSSCIEPKVQVPQFFTQANSKVEQNRANGAKEEPKEPQIRAIYSRIEKSGAKVEQKRDNLEQNRAELDPNGAKVEQSSLVFIYLKFIFWVFFLLCNRRGQWQENRESLGWHVGKRSLEGARLNHKVICTPQK